MGRKGQYLNNESRSMGCRGLHKETNEREIRMETKELTFIRI